MIADFMKDHPEVTRDVALKFNLGRKFVKERVGECYRNYQETVKEHHFEKVTAADVLDELRTQKMYIPGTRDRSGAALFIINAGKHVPGQFSTTQTLKLAFYMGELLTSDPKTSQIGVTIISNMDGMEWANFDNQFQRSIINFFQNNIPARVKNIILYKSPWWVSMLVRMVSPFLKQKMRERIHICNEGDLLQFVESDQLPRDLGGTFEYDHESFVKREIAKVPTAVIMGTAPKVTDGEEDGEGGREGDVPHRTPPPGTVMLISDELAETLLAERALVLTELDEKIRRRRESLCEHSLPLDISKVLRSKNTRRSLDLSAIPTLEPNLLHLRDARLGGQSSLLVAMDKSPLAERPDEDYDPEKLENRIHKSIMKDRQSFLKKMRRHAAISGVSSVHEYEVPSEEEEGPPLEDEEQDSDQSFTNDDVKAQPEQNVPLMPTPKKRFSKFVPASAIQTEVDDDNDDDNDDELDVQIFSDEEEESATVESAKVGIVPNQLTEPGDEDKESKPRRKSRRAGDEAAGQRRRKTTVFKTLDELEVQEG